MSPVVSLDMLPADSPAEYAPAMVAACTDTLAAGRCALASELPESSHPDAVALILWQGQAFLEVTVRVGQGDGKWVSRHLTFAESDSMAERYTTVGLTAAALVGDALPPPAPPAPAPSPAVPARDTPDSQPKVQPPRARLLRAQVGGLTGPGWAGAGWQRGAWASLGVRWPRAPLLLYGFGSYAASVGPRVGAGELSSGWLTLALGGGTIGQWLGVAGSASLEVGARRVAAELEGKSATTWEVPVRLRGLLAYPAEGPFALTAGGLLRLPPGSGEASETHARLGFSGELLIGLEVRP